MKLRQLFWISGCILSLSAAVFAQDQSFQTAVSIPSSAAQSGSASVQDAETLDQAGIAYTPKETITKGSQHYFSSDTSLAVDLPGGFGINTGYSFYRSDISSRTATIYLGATKDWANGALGATFAVTPKSNNYKSNALDLIGSLSTSSTHYRTIVSGDITFTHHTQTNDVPGSKGVTSDTNIRQVASTINVSQRLLDTKLAANYSKSTYDKDITRLNNRLLPQSARFSGLTGLLQGFPDTSFKFGVYQDLGFIPVTPWATYEHINLLVAATSGQTGQSGQSDSYTAGIDIEFLSIWMATLQYNHLWRSSQPLSDYLGLSLSVRL